MQSFQITPKLSKAVRLSKMEKADIEDLLLNPQEKDQVTKIFQANVTVLNDYQTQGNDWA